MYALVFSSYPGKGRLYSSSYDRTIKVCAHRRVHPPRLLLIAQVWSIDTWTEVQTLERHQNSVNALALTKGRLLSGAADNAIKVWQ